MKFRCALIASIGLVSGAILTGEARAAGHDHDKHDHEKHEHREHGAHVHGAGKLNLVLDGNALELEYVAPGYDIVGFERAAVFKREKKQLKEATETLKAGDPLFAFPKSAGCKMQTSSVKFVVEDLGHDHDHDHAHDHKDVHKHAHDHKDTHKHADGHDHEHEMHTEFQMHYAFTCAKPQNVEYLDVKLFEAFERTQKITVQAITPRGQAAADLTPKNIRVQF